MISKKSKKSKKIYYYVVYNSSWGGFGISKEGIKYLKDQGMTQKQISKMNMGSSYGRHNRHLVNMVKKLKKKANTDGSYLKIKRITIPIYTIVGYDGMEEVITPNYNPVYKWNKIKKTKNIKK